jgi:hypothetical protein
MIRTQIQLEEADYEQAKQAAARLSCSVSAFVRECVKSGLREAERRLGQENIEGLAGKYRSGRGDLARRHDDYLEDGW